KADEGYFVGYSMNRKEEKKDAKDPGNEDNDDPRVANNINTVTLTANATSIKDNAVDKHIVYGCVDDLSMHNLEEVNYSDDDEDVGAEADMTNLDTSIPKDENNVTNYEPNKVIQALTDPSWIEAMQDELILFKLQQVYTLVDLPYGKRAIGTKWIYRNKKYERVARIEAIRLFLAYASFKDFVVYHTDVKSAFMYGKVKEEVYVYQSLRFEDPVFPDRIYKVE
nr:hypothetical protein [Tanacetum cinerariifolium]